MSKRLQVLFEETEFEELREAARRDGVPVSEWVREALRDSRRRKPRGSLETKIAAVRAAAQHEFPTAEIDDMLAEIEREYASPPSE